MDAEDLSSGCLLRAIAASIQSVGLTGTVDGSTVHGRSFAGLELRRGQRPGPSILRIPVITELRRRLELLREGDAWMTDLLTAGDTEREDHLAERINEDMSSAVAEATIPGRTRQVQHSVDPEPMEQRRSQQQRQEPDGRVYFS